MRFRPCIDLYQGRVTQIVGASLRDADSSGLVTHFKTEQSPADYARMYSADGLSGGHVVMLGPGNESAALSALRAFPGGLQVGGGITPENASRYLQAGASHVIVTSYVFEQGRLQTERLKLLCSAVGRERLVLDLSCRRKGSAYVVVSDRWQRFTDIRVSRANLVRLAGYCSEFLVHAVDVEGSRTGIEDGLVSNLSRWSPIPVTYAGGASRLEDLERVKSLGQDRVDLTIGSALDIFGGQVSYRQVVAWQREQLRSAL